MKKLNNKGFSLVELIIVIAIMVILVAVIAPQYLKFVNNSKVSTDVQTASDVATAINVAVADSQKPFGSSSSITMTAGYSSYGIGNLQFKLGSTTQFVVTGDDISGVTKITDGTYELWPNPDTSSTGYNAHYKK